MEHGLAVVFAVFALSPNQISGLTGIRFDTAKEGDFDYVLAALLVTEDGKQFALRCYHRGPYPNRTELVGSERSQNPLRDLERFIGVLGIPRKHLLWQLAGLSGAFKQINLADMEPGFGRRLAVLSLLPRHIGDVTGLTFETMGKSGAGHGLAALVETKDGRQFLLRQGLQKEASNTTEIVGSLGSTNPVRDLGDFMDLLGLTKDYLLWSIADINN